jgi:hypothetical protein
MIQGHHNVDIEMRVSTPKTTSVAALLASVIVTSVAPFYVSGVHFPPEAENGRYCEESRQRCKLL